MGTRLAGKVAIVTGAGSNGPGIGNGKAAAIVYAREGARVMLVDRNLDAAEETQRLIADEGGESFAFRADVSRSDGVSGDGRRACIERYGAIDILHNNVAIPGEPGGPVEVSEESWTEVLAVNLTSVFLACKHVIPHMERRRRRLDREHLEPRRNPRPPAPPQRRLLRHQGGDRGAQP